MVKMNSIIEDFIKTKYEELNQRSDDEYTTLTIRLSPKDALMLKVIASGLNFPISTTFTKIIPEHLYNMILSLNDKDFEEFTKRFYSGGYRDTVWMKKLIDNEVLEDFGFWDIFAKKSDLLEIE